MAFILMTMVGEITAAKATRYAVIVGPCGRIIHVQRQLAVTRPPTMIILHFTAAPSAQHALFGHRREGIHAVDPCARSDFSLIFWLKGTHPADEEGQLGQNRASRAHTPLMGGAPVAFATGRALVVHQGLHLDDDGDEITVVNATIIRVIMWPHGRTTQSPRQLVDSGPHMCNDLWETGARTAPGGPCARRGGAYQHLGWRWR